MADSGRPTGAVPETGTIAGPAGPISYARRHGAGPTLVLVHGNTSDRSLWNPLLAAWPEADLLALDSRGHGASGWPADPDYASAHFAEDIVAAVAAFGLDRPVLVGHSNGAISALLAATRLDPAPRALVWIDLDPKVPAEQVAYFHQRAAVADRVSPSLERLVEGMRGVDDTVPVAVLRAHVEHLVRPVDGGWRFGFDPRFYAHWQPADTWPLLPALRVPTTVVRGASSRVMAAEAARRMAAMLPDGRLETVEGTGHWLPLARPEALAAILRAAITRGADR